MLRWFFVSVVVIVAEGVSAQPAAFPNTSPPRFAVVSEFDVGKGLVRFIERQVKAVPKTVRMEEVIDGRKQIVERIVIGAPYTVETVQVEVAAKLEQFEIVNGEGKPQAPAAVGPTMKGRLVLLVPDESGLHPSYLKLLDRDALVFVRKPAPKKPR